jgi:hypothetical protein
LIQLFRYNEVKYGIAQKLQALIARPRETRILVEVRRMNESLLEEGFPAENYS